ncbi:hypothetical protein [Herbidospora mongoliensis]|uniref:hypothetical protein n=1 Tax=Herbidospora mongoliensis TaxID=688067 RepID=UPI0008352B35|nr:hypothetical protein [Herbidospora mongoliensis]
MHDRAAGLAEYQRALAKAKEQPPAAPSSVNHRARGIAIALLGLAFVLIAGAGFYSDWYGPTYGRSTTGTVAEVEGRTMYVTFTTAEGVPQVGSTKKFPGARVGEQREILYLEGSPSTGVVDIWNPEIPPSMPLSIMFALAGLGAVAAGVMEFSGRAPWRDAVVLDEASIKAR